MQNHAYDALWMPEILIRIDFYAFMSHFCLYIEHVDFSQ